MVFPLNYLQKLFRFPWKTCHLRVKGGFRVSQDISRVRPSGPGSCRLTMAFVPWCAAGDGPSAGDGGMEAFVCRSWKKETQRRTSWNLVSLRVPGTAADRYKSSSAPDVIRIWQEPCAQKKPRKTLYGSGFVIVPEMTDIGAPEKRQSSEMSASSSVPSIKRCSLDEIEAIKRSLGRLARNVKTGTKKIRRRPRHRSELHRIPLRYTQAPKTPVIATPG